MILNECNIPIKSIELQLVRVETCGCAEGYSKDCKCWLWKNILLKIFFCNFSLLFKVTEIQNVQIGEGDVLRGVQIPIYMIFPRLFTCPSLLTTNFKIGNILNYKTMVINLKKTHGCSFFVSPEFEVNLVIVFEDDRLITENFPLKLTRY